jgi:hypothetical protein
MSEKSLLDQWRDMAYDRNLSKNGADILRLRKKYMSSFLTIRKRK